MIKSSDIVYIAGPMTGKRLYNYHKFFGLAGVIRKVYQCEVLNPARQPEGLPYEEYLRRALLDVSHASVIVLMKSWSYSHGARLEYQEALKRGIRILTEQKVVDNMQARLKSENPTIRIGEMSHD